MLINFLKKIIIAIIVTTVGIPQGIVGEYKLTGLNIVDYDFVRQNTDIVVVEKSGWDLSPKVAYTLEQGENIDYDPRIPYPLYALTATEVQIMVYFAEDGTATILEGSMYPTEQSGEGCFTEEVTLPIQEDFSYVIDLNSNENIPLIDILGFESLSPYKGLPTGSISISGSSVFDVVPITPTEISMPFPIDTSSVMNNSNGVLSENTPLPGLTAGYAMKSTAMYTFIPAAYNCDIPGFGCPPRPSLYLEWHAIDGTVNESGLGDIIGEDEDGDGTDFDSIYGLDKVKVTKVYSTNECGLNSYDIVGNHIETLRTVKYNQCLNSESNETGCMEIANSWINSCIDVEDIEDVGNNLYLMDLNQDSNFNWGGYVTWNSTLYNATENSNYLVDDSNENFNSSCLDGCSPQLTEEEFIICSQDCSGRFIFEYTPQCIPSFNMRYFMAELQEQCQESDKDECGVCFGDGIPEGYCDCHFGYKDCSGTCDIPSNCLSAYCDDWVGDTSCFGCDGVANSGISDSDGDGLCDNVDECIGEIDECGICNGNGVIQECGCGAPGEFGIPDGECDCLGTLPIAYCIDNDDDGDGGVGTEQLFCSDPGSQWSTSCNDEIDNCDGVLDDCELCDGNNIDKDCFGICFGDGALDECGVCDGNGILVNECDCDGNVEDECGVCGGDGVLDECGICDGTGKETYCYDFDNDLIGNQNTANTYCPNSVPNQWVPDCSSMEILDLIPNQTAISNIFPNPFNPNINIEFQLDKHSNIDIKIYDLNGRLVNNLINRNYNIGTHIVTWDASSFSSGIYFVKLKSGDKIITEKIELLK